MKLYSIKEAAEVLGLSCGLIYALCARKKIRHERYGLGRGTIKIPEDAIDEYRQSVTLDLLASGFDTDKGVLFFQSYVP